MSFDPRKASVRSEHNRLLSKPIDLHWLGWKSDTATLMNYGWQISCDQNIVNRSMQFAIQYHDYTRSGERIRGLSEMSEFDYLQYIQQERYGQFRPVMPIFNMNMAYNVHVRMAGEINTNFMPIDARPTMAYDFKIHNIEDFAHFKTVDKDAHEIWLQEASMNEVLRVALSKQSETQAEIRHKMIKRQEMEEYRRNSKLAAELRIAL